MELETMFATLLNGETLVELTLMDQAFVLILATILGLIIAQTYKYTHNSLSYSQSFTQGLVILTPLVGVVMLIIGSSIIRAFTLLGALAIIRFRNAVKEPWDTVVLFFTVVVGMSIGSRLFIFGLMITLVICALMIILNKSKFGIKTELMFVESEMSKESFNKLRKLFDIDLISVEKDTTQNKYVFKLGETKKSKVEHFFLKENITTFTILKGGVGANI